MTTAGSVVGGRLGDGWYVPETGWRNGGTVGLTVADGALSTGSRLPGFVGPTAIDGSFDGVAVGGRCGFEGRGEGNVDGGEDVDGYVVGEADLDGAGDIEGKEDDDGFSVFMVRVVGRIDGF